MARRAPPSKNTVYPVRPDMTIQASASPRASLAQAGLLVGQPSTKQEYTKNRDFLAALDANPRAARMLDRNRMLILAIPLAILIILAVMYLT